MTGKWFLFYIIFAVIMSACAPAAAYEAYIDDASGIVVARGETTRGKNESYASAKKRAVDDARSNLLQMLERQYVDTNSTTIGQLLNQQPDKRPIVNRYIDTAKIFKDSEQGGKVKVTLTLKYSGDDSYQSMVAQLQGKEPAADSGGDNTPLSDSVLEDLRNTYATRDPALAGKPYRVAILTFANKSAYKNIDLGAALTGLLKKRLADNPHIVVLDDAEAAEAISKAGLSADIIRESAANANLKIDGIDGIVTGAVTRYEGTSEKHGISSAGYLEMAFFVDADLRILDAKSGRWLVYEPISVTKTDRSFSLTSADDADKFILKNQPDSTAGLAGVSFDEMLSGIDGRVRASFPLEGYVLMVKADSVYINLAKTDGVKEGDTLIVYRLGDMLTDPVSGNEIDRVRDRIGTIKIVDVGDKYSTGKTDDLFSEQPAQGDIVTLK